MKAPGSKSESDTDMTVEQWLALWRRDFTPNLKANTEIYYDQLIRSHIVPTLGSTPLHSLRTADIQHMFKAKAEGGLSSKSIKNLHGCLHKALDVAVKAGYLSSNPSDACVLPRVQQKEISPLDIPDIKKLLHYLHGKPFEALITVDLFTGMRSGELIGLTWDCVDFEKGQIHVDKQLITPRRKGDTVCYGTPKNGKGRVLTPAPMAMEALKAQKEVQEKQKAALGPAWNDYGFPGLVFTYPNGKHLSQSNVSKILNKILKEAGIEHHRVHDLRHTYVVNSLLAGDDVKTVQQNAGHYSAAFTLDRYAHVTDTMKKASADRMQKFFESLE